MKEPYCHVGSAIKLVSETTLRQKLSPGRGIRAHGCSTYKRNLHDLYVSLSSPKFRFEN